MQGHALYLYIMGNVAVPWFGPIPLIGHQGTHNQLAKWCGWWQSGHYGNDGCHDCRWHRCCNWRHSRWWRESSVAIGVMTATITMSLVTTMTLWCLWRDNENKDEFNDNGDDNDSSDGNGNDMATAAAAVAAAATSTTARWLQQQQWRQWQQWPQWQSQWWQWQQQKWWQQWLQRQQQIACQSMCLLPFLLAWKHLWLRTVDGSVKKKGFVSHPKMYCTNVLLVCLAKVRF